MKHSIFLAFLGLGVTLASSYGDGYVYFTSAEANHGLGATTSVYGTGTLIGTPFVAELYYSIGLVSDPVDLNSAASITSAPSAAFTLYTGANGVAPYVNLGSAGSGYFDNGAVVIPGYTYNPLNPFITFEVIAFDGSSYDTSDERGRSGSFFMDGITTNPMNPPSFFGDNEENMP